MNGLPIVGIAKPGDIVFLECQTPMPYEQIERLRQMCSDAASQAGVKIFVLPYGVRLARVEVPHEIDRTNLSTDSRHAAIRELCQKFRKKQGGSSFTANHLHAGWDVVFDAENILKGEPSLVKWDLDELIKTLEKYA
jgi:hypothetical protein